MLGYVTVPSSTRRAGKTASDLALVNAVAETTVVHEEPRSDPTPSAHVGEEAVEVANLPPAPLRACPDPGTTRARDLGGCRAGHASASLHALQRSLGNRHFSSSCRTRPEYAVES